MNIDAPNFMIPSSETLYESKLVQQIIPGGEHRRVYLVVTEFNIYLFVNRKESMDLLACHPHKDLVRLDALDEVTFRLTFKSENPYTFFDEAPNRILGKILEAISVIILPDSYPQVCTPNPLPNAIKKTNEDLYYCLQQRYRAILAWQQIYPTQFLLQSLDRFLKLKPRSIDLGIIEDLGFNVAVFLDAVDIQPLVTTLIIPTRQQSNYYEILQQYLPHTNSLKKIIFHEPLNDSFCHFFSTIRKFRLFSIEAMEFVECTITAEISQLINKFLNQHKITISLTKCDITQCETNLVQICESQTQNLLGIHMTSVWLNDSLSLRSALLKLNKLSLRGCRIKIDEFLTTLSASSTQIVSIDLSKNYCLDPFSAKIAFPDSLREIFLNDVKWIESNFSTVFNQACQAASSEFSFSVANANFNDRSKSFDKFFKKLDLQGGTSLTYLYWNCNSLSTRFLQFLLKCSNLKFLSLSGCKIKKSVSYALQKLIENHKSLVILDIHGTLNNALQTNISKLLSWVKKSKIIRRVDISHNKMDAHCIAKLADLISTNQMIRQVLIDDLSLDDYEAFEPLVHALRDRSMVIYIQFPEDYINKMKKKGFVTEEIIAEIRPLFKAPLSPENQECHEQWQKLIDHDYQEYQLIEESKEPVPPLAPSLIPSAVDSSEYTPKDTVRVIRMDLFEIPVFNIDLAVSDFESKHELEEMRKTLENLIFTI